MYYLKLKKNNVLIRTINIESIETIDVGEKIVTLYMDRGFTITFGLTDTGASYILTETKFNTLKTAIGNLDGVNFNI